MKNFLLLFILIGMSRPVFSQDPPLWLSADFRLILRDIEWDYFKTNYSIKTYLNDSVVEEKSIYKDDLYGDTLHYHFSSCWSLDTLTFGIQNNTTKAEMKVTVLHMYVNQNYFIHLTRFTPGHFMFDWWLIGPCLERDSPIHLIDCHGKQLVQLETKQDAVGFWDFKIVPVDIYQFRGPMKAVLPEEIFELPYPP